MTDVITFLFSSFIKKISLQAIWHQKCVIGISNVIKEPTFHSPKINSENVRQRHYEWKMCRKVLGDKLTFHVETERKIPEIFGKWQFGCILFTTWTKRKLIFRCFRKVQVNSLSSILLQSLLSKYKATTSKDEFTSSYSWWLWFQCCVYLKLLVGYKTHVCVYLWPNAQLHLIVRPQYITLVSIFALQQCM